MLIVAEDVEDYIAVTIVGVLARTDPGPVRDVSPMTADKKV